MPKKKCKSRTGLKRHKTAKHREEQTKEQQCDFAVHNLEVMVAKAKAKIVDSKVYPKYLRDELKSHAFSSNHLSTDISELCNIVKRLLKSGNAEKFYSSFYSRIVMNATKVFEGLSRNAATLLALKTADCLLAKKKAKDEAEIPHLATKFSDKETSGLQYIGGYVLHKLQYIKHSKRGNSTVSQQSMSILRTGKADDPDVVDSQQLTSSLNRGGLWAISKNAQTIFERTEHSFRVVTGKPCLQRIDTAAVVSKSVSDTDVVAAFTTMLSDTELTVDNVVGKDLLYNIVDLYVRVQSFSFAKDIIQKHKIKAKQLKEKALRKDISRASAEAEKQRQP